MAIADYTEQGKATEETKALATRPVDLVNFKEGGSGDFDSKDIEIPYLLLVAGQGKLSKDRRFHQGDLVLMGEYLISLPMRATVFGFTKYWVQNIEYQQGVFPTQLATEADVIASGGNVDEYKEAGSDPDNFIRAAAIKLAIELDEKLAITVPGVLEYKEKLIVRALWTVKKAAFKSLIQRFNNVEGPLKLKGKSIAAKHGEFTVREKDGKGFTYHVPEFKVLGDNDAEYLEFLRSIF